MIPWLEENRLRLRHDYRRKKVIMVPLNGWGFIGPLASEWCPFWYIEKDRKRKRESADLVQLYVYRGSSDRCRLSPPALGVVRFGNISHLSKEGGHLFVTSLNTACHRACQLWDVEDLKPLLSDSTKRYKVVHSTYCTRTFCCHALKKQS
jgi:hypothetical protein